ncbi:hypothetical protein E4656_18675 [Natronospirillum operosum]|uniref:Bacteriocin n=1 Tax=Natronospirillum operosum TaxID=2759953 RepID=A0A4Z0W6Z8_9GAMM|nr:hypothetical protein [Natronospirillum operosum]TGG90289.1 hypothetical protein E4656_18675 [Natronospirillum operosum]
MSKLYAQHNLMTTELDAAYGGGGGSSSNTQSNTEAANTDALLQCTAEATTAGLITGAGFSATGPGSILIGTATGAAYVLSGQGACSDVDLNP